MFHGIYNLSGKVVAATALFCKAQASKAKQAGKLKKIMEKIIPVLRSQTAGCRAFIYMKYRIWTMWITHFLKETCSATPCVLVGIFLETVFETLEDKYNCNIDCVEPPGCNLEGCGLQVICPYVCCECDNPLCTSLTPVEINQLTVSYPEWRPYNLCTRDD